MTVFFSYNYGKSRQCTLHCFNQYISPVSAPAFDLQIMGNVFQDSSRLVLLKDEPIENHRPLKVRVIGAGISGVYLGIRIPQRLRNVDLAIYEKNDGLGGTWWENRYPGCACDIPGKHHHQHYFVVLCTLIGIRSGHTNVFHHLAHAYQYTFEPNPKWSGFYATSQEIRDYIHFVADKYGVPRFVKLQHEVTNCMWDDSKKKWSVKKAPPDVLDGIQ